MSIFKRGKTYWYNFWWDTDHIQESTHQGNPRVARQIEAAHKTALAKGEVGIRERQPVPTLKIFAQRFTDAIQVRCAAKPRTVEFYEQQLARLLEFEPVAQANLDDIDEGLIESFVQHRSEEVSPATVNRALATLRRLLRLAQEWHVVDRVPRIRMLQGEVSREFVLTHSEEKIYLEFAAQPLRDIAMLMLDSGLRAGEVIALTWCDVHLQPANGARSGYLQVREGKTRNAKRNLPLTSRVRAMLAGRQEESQCAYVFGEGNRRPMMVSSLDHLHRRVRSKLQLPEQFVLHSLRHTYLTRLGLSGADAFTLMKLAGHSCITISQRYVHPTPESMEQAVEKLEHINGRSLGSGPLPREGKQ